ncbi:hypothetical protein ES288_D05G337100v1 [Gossypium darwinii]|uniref:Uncharacterized protein n=1 Tax=Gossypium darwinii TaxID=34276 RepID=A0A5D2CMK6_GOSDA|nr:hypothetical protein ES288_D05G337100v1 [Gossypium darwinii]
MVNIIGGVSLWIIGTVIDIPVINLIGIFFMVHSLDYIRLCNMK